MSQQGILFTYGQSFKKITSIANLKQEDISTEKHSYFTILELILLTHEKQTQENEKYPVFPVVLPSFHSPRTTRNTEQDL